MPETVGSPEPMEPSDLAQGKFDSDSKQRPGLHRFVEEKTPASGIPRREGEKEARHSEGRSLQVNRVNVDVQLSIRRRSGRNCFFKVTELHPRVKFGHFDL